MGASVEYIWSYINQLGITTKTSHLEDLLDKLPFLFRMQTTGVGALIERKWQFTGYKDMNMLEFLWKKCFRHCILRENKTLWDRILWEKKTIMTLYFIRKKH